MTGSLYSERDRSDDVILGYLAEGWSPMDIAMFLTEDDVSAGEYDGCSFELDLAASEYAGRAERILNEVGGV